ncbi:MAG: hypothetical protein WA058_02330 [Minisyncoccia bacterium]
MNGVRNRALKLRLVGKSYNEIRDSLGVPKSTLSGWFKHVVLSDAASARLRSRSSLGSATLIKRNKLQTKKAIHRAREIQESAKKKIPVLTKRDLLVVGTVLYWAEGYKRLKIKDGKERMDHTISFVNADAEMISVFVQFLQNILRIPSEKIRLTMRLYAHINENEARAHWMRATGLSCGRFFKTTFLVSGASKGIRPFNRLPWGSLQVEVCDTAKFHHLIGMIEGVKEKLSHGKMQI